MYLVAGLGNPGTQYEMTRHNIGFEVIDYLADKYNIKVKKLKYKSLYADTTIGGEKVLFVKVGTNKNEVRTSVMSTDFREVECDTGIAITLTIFDKELSN